MPVNATITEELMKELETWRGRTQTHQDVLDLHRCRQMAAALDSELELDQGSALPAPWHWLFFQPIVSASRTGLDGHEIKSGEFLPPIPLPRRMWASGTVEYGASSLHIGDAVTKRSRVKDVVLKQGKNGQLVFVTVEHEFLVAQSSMLQEVQTIVYRDPPKGGPKAGPAPSPIDDGQYEWTSTITPDPVLLFRYSALTFNSHRIHYDRDYAVSEEGYKGLVVHGPLTASLLLDELRRNVPEFQLKRFSFRAMSPLFDGEAITINARRSDDGLSLFAFDQHGKCAMEMSCEKAQD